MTDAPEGIFGIDLGTTYSVVSYIDDSGKPVIVKDMLESSDTTPSVVFFENEKNVVVGNLAKESAVIAPDQVVSMVKRHMGDKDWRKEVFGQSYSAPDISAQILGSLARNAEAETGRKMHKVVITVPAYFGMLEKQATRQAGEIAGLEVVEVVPEPVAAALAYGLASEPGDRTILVFDLGGGTFDVTMMNLTETSLDVVVVDGNHMLGGHDWDAALFESLSDRAMTAFGDDTLTEDSHFVQNLWNQTEEVKKRLSQTEERPIILQSSGGSEKLIVTRAEFEQLTAHLIEQTLVITRRGLGERRREGARHHQANC